MEEGDCSHQQKASFEPPQSFKLEYSLGTHRANLRSKPAALISAGKLPTAAADATLAVLAAEEESVFNSQIDTDIVSHLAWANAR